ncbi:MAG: hypothetical protein GY858_01315 [Candidatus Omnitrophica bacterium]|nr:hypothetical protein [Candidatus Omnitrophota bacterium]
MKNNDNEDIQFRRKQREEKFFELGDYCNNYSVDQFMVDLADYFNNEVDFNLDKIRRIIESPGKLDTLVNSAINNKTHPVSEFIQSMLKDSTGEQN